MKHGLKPQLQLSPRHRAAIQDAAAAAYPNECCGLLVGEGDEVVTVTEVVPTANTADDPRRAFAIDPQEQFNLLRATRGPLENGKSRRVVGHYHSHPDGSAAPSRHDLAMAYDPEALWVVVATSREGASPPRAFCRPEGADTFVEIELIA
ncbi:MAG: M67 family metallopeptidase [Rhodospirillaceae bacterium]|nr:M67 family metallopeptidase [Rhodospirillaceae bacterium]